MWGGSGAARLVAMAVVLSMLVSPGVAEGAPQEASTPPAQPPVSVVSPRLAYTNERDEIYSVEIGRPDFAIARTRLDQGNPRVLPGGGPSIHRGEASTSNDLENPAAVYISTEDHPSGEVYLQSASDAPPRRVTCDNEAVESHPVLSPDGTRLAYASDRNGNVDIWTARIDQDADPEDGACAGVLTAPLTSSDAADLWPAWSPDGSQVIFSSDREDPLGDLFALPYVERPPGEGADESGLVQLTSGPDADTQPAAGRYEGEESTTDWLVFTTTRFRSDGSLATLALPDPAAQYREDGAVTSLWPESPDPLIPEWRTEQGTEAAWSSDGGHIAFTSTRGDPAGDIRLARLGVDGEGRLMADPLTMAAVGSLPGRAESHAAWLPGSARGPSTLLYTARATPAHIADVVTADGSDRRVLSVSDEESPADEAGPSYSPDGTSLVWSRRVGGELAGRQLVIAAADGTQQVPLAYERGGRDIDVDPAWSPDGGRIAFTRHAWNGDGYDAPATWIVDLKDDPRSQEVAVSRRASTPDPEGPRYAEENPSWSPSGGHLVVSRRAMVPDLGVALTSVTADPERDAYTVTGTVANLGEAASSATRLEFRIPVGLKISDVAGPCVRDNEQRTVVCQVKHLSPGERVAHQIYLTGVTAGEHAVEANAVPVEHERVTANNEATVGVSVPPRPDLEIALSASQPTPTEGTDDLVTVTAEVRNAGSAPSAATMVTFELPTNFSLYSSRACDGNDAGVVECRIEPLDPQVASDIDFQMVGTLPERVDVLAKVDAVQREINKSNNDASVEIASEKRPDLALNLVVPPEYVENGREFEIKARVTNDRTGRATPSTELSFMLPLGLTFVDGPSDCGDESAQQVVICQIDRLPRGKSIELSIYARSSSLGVEDTGRREIKATVTPVAEEVTEENNTARTTVSLLPVIGAPPPIRHPEAPVGLQLAATSSPEFPRPLHPTLPEIWVIDVDAGSAAALRAPEPCEGDCAVRGRSPDWSPDGLSIAFVEQGQLNVAALVGADGAPGPDVPHVAASLTSVTGFEDSGAATAARAVVSSTDDPSWSPDGASLAFAGQPAGHPSRTRIYIVAPDGSGLRAIVQDRAPESEPDVQPWADVSLLLAFGHETIQPDGTTTMTATLTNHGPRGAVVDAVRIELPAGIEPVDPAPEACELQHVVLTCTPGSLDAGGSAVYDLTVRGGAEGDHTVVATVTTRTPDSDGSNNQASASLQVHQDSTTDPPSTTSPRPNPTDLTVDLILDRDTGWTGGQPVTATATVSNRGQDRATGARVSFDLPEFLGPVPSVICIGPDPVCALGDLDAGEQRSVSVLLVMPSEAADGEITVQAGASTPDPEPGNNRDTSAISVLQPSIRVLPGVATPGRAVLVMVDDVPPGAEVSFAWSRGIGLTTVGAAGSTDTSIRRPVVIIRKDQLGEREIIVRSTSGQFADLRSSLLVVPRSVSPMPDFIGRG